MCMKENLLESSLYLSAVSIKIEFNWDFQYMLRQSIFNNKMNILLFSTITSFQGQLLNTL